MLTIESLAAALQQASQSDRHLAQLAENQLKEWETISGYHFMLQSIYLNTSLPLQIRWLAIITFKNGIDKYWRATKVNAISKEEKVSIRSRLFELNEPNTQLVLQNVQACSRIARLDFPVEWPSMFEDLQKRLEGDQIGNILLYLNQIIKVLSAARIGRCRPAMQAKLPILIPVLIKLYHQHWSSIDVTSLELAYLSLKVLRRIIENMDQPHHSQEVSDFMALSIQHFQSLLNNQSGEKFIKCMSKMYYNLIHHQPSEFISFPCSLEILTTFYTVLQTKAEIIYQDSESMWEQLGVRAFLIIKKLVNFIFKKGALSLRSKADKATIDQAITKIRTNFLTEAAIKNMVDLMMKWYMKLRPSDLESWKLEPEEWFNEQASWEYQIRPCAENVFMDLINVFKDTLVPYLMEKLQQDVGNDDIARDAIFTSFQLSSQSIDVDFNSLFPTILSQVGSSVILQRRVCLVLTNWITHASRETRIEGYKILLQVLSQSHDIVVKLTAVDTLKNMVKDWDFNKEDFQGFQDATAESLLSVLAQLTLTESKLFLLDGISDVIQFSAGIENVTLIKVLSAIPPLWQHENDAILKNSILRILKHLVTALGSKSSATYEISIPALQISVDPESEYYSTCYEDGYELWHALLTNTNNYEPFVPFLRFLSLAIDSQTEILHLLLQIFRSYIMLMPIDSTSLAIINQLGSYMSMMRDDSFDILMSILEIIVLQGEFEALYPLLNSFYEFIAKDEYTQSIKVFSILSRLALAKPESLSQMPAQILNIWIEKFDMMAEPRTKKLSLLGITNLIRSLNRDLLPPVLKLWCLTLEEINETESGDSEKYHQYGYSYEYYDEVNTCEYDRYLQLVKTRDPVHTMNLRVYLGDLLVQLSSEGFQLEQNLVENLQLFIQIKPLQQ